MDWSLAGLRLGPSLALAGAAVLLLLALPRPLEQANRSDASLALASAASSTVASIGRTKLDQDAAPTRLAQIHPLAVSDPSCPENRFDLAPVANPPHRAPDLARLYHEVVASAGAQAGQVGQPGTCASPSGGDSLSASLRASYGAELRVGTDASRFAGPFPVAEWRGGTILAGFPEEGGLPSVLIAESESSLNCCIDLVAPRDPSLRVFAWRQGTLVLIEITQRTQPRFLDRFELL